MIIVKNMNWIHYCASVTQGQAVMEVQMTRAQVSFEVFPPQSVDASFRLWQAVQALSPLSPDFVSVTYGAGGGTRSQTQETLATLQRTYGVEVAAHLTCLGATRAQTLQTAAAFAALGVRQIVALRGDAPQGSARFTPHPDGFGDTVELVAALAKTGLFTLRVAAYPERHPDAPNAQADVDWLKRKIDAGASSAITQFFFKADTFLRFRDACAKAGITAPVIPGILPIQSWAGAKRFAARCGASVPQRLDEGFTAAARDGRERLFALTQCATLCERLLAEGVGQLHFYTLNCADLTRDVVRALGLTSELTPQLAQSRVA